MNYDKPFQRNLGDPTGVYSDGVKVGEFIDEELAELAITNSEELAEYKERTEEEPELTIDNFNELLEVEKRFKNNAANKTDALDSIYEAIQFLDKDDVYSVQKVMAIKGYLRDIEKKLEELDLPAIKKKAVRKKRVIKKG